MLQRLILRKMESRSFGSLLNYHRATERGNAQEISKEKISKGTKTSKLDQCYIPAKPTSWLQDISSVRGDSLWVIQATVLLVNPGESVPTFPTDLTPPLHTHPRPPLRRTILAYGKAASELPGAGLDSGPGAAGTEVSVVQAAAGQSGVGSCPLWGGTCAAGPPL